MSARINLGDLKSQITKRVGPDRAQCYFGYLSRLLSQKISKNEFNKLCISTLGRENLPLHNQLIHAIFRNACQAKTPPPSVVEKNVSKLPHSLPPVLSNGDLLPPSPRRSRSSIRRIKDRPSPIGPNGRIEVAIANQSLHPHNEVVVRENGDLDSYDLKRPVQHLEDELAEQPMKRSRRAKESLTGLVWEVDVDDARENFEQRNDLKSPAKVPLQAPLGIPFCPPSVGGARRPLTLDTSVGIANFISSRDSGELCHSEDLRRRMERIAEAQGLGVTLDCANLLNSGLDAYLKRLIKSCAELSGARSGHGQMKQPVYKQQVHGKPINGVWQGNHIHVQSGGLPLDGVHGPTNHRAISLQDFRVAVELYPQHLGDDWPLLLEKICLHSFEE